MTEQPTIHICSAEEAEESDFIICVKASCATPFTDNETGACFDCGEPVQFRPYMPKAPGKLCMECFYDRVRGGHD